MQMICVLITNLFAPGIVCYRIPSQKIFPFVFDGDISSLLCLHQCRHRKKQFDAILRTTEASRCFDIILNIYCLNLELRRESPEYHLKVKVKFARVKTGRSDNTLLETSI